MAFFTFNQIFLFFLFYKSISLYNIIILDFNYGSIFSQDYNNNLELKKIFVLKIFNLSKSNNIIR